MKKLVEMSYDDLINNNFLLWEGLTKVNKDDLKRIDSDPTVYKSLKIIIAKKIKLFNSLDDSPPGVCYLCEIAARKQKEIIKEEEAEYGYSDIIANLEVCKNCVMYNKWRNLDWEMYKRCNSENTDTDTYYDEFQFAVIANDADKARRSARKILKNMKDVLK